MCIVPYFMEDIYVPTIEPIAECSQVEVIVEDVDERASPHRDQGLGSAAVVTNILYRLLSRKQSWK